MASFVENVWYRKSPVGNVVGAALAPASWLFNAAVIVRNRAFDRPGEVTEPAIPALSIGNLTVGGTGKTPLAAWAARELADCGAKPAIVLRGYGSDEPLVHKYLNDDVIVIADPDRVHGVQRAAQSGADCAILDDAFQHRRIARVSDWVLISAEQWRRDLRVLPAGPLREPLAALSRASVVVVSRKSASKSDAERVTSEISGKFPRARIARVHFELGDVVNLPSGHRNDLGWLAGRRISAAAAVGMTSVFFAQLRAAGAEVSEFAFRDHHSFSAADLERLVAAAERTEGMVCTLKDAVKLAPVWPANAAPLWYVSQRVTIEDGRAALDLALEGVLAVRRPPSSTAGSAGQRSPLNGHRSSTAD